MSLLDQFGKPLRPVGRRQMTEEIAAPTLIGVRPPISGHPADGMTPVRLASIMRSAAQGDALSYLELAEDIEERDLHYSGVLATRKRSVSQLPITVEAASDDAEHVKHKEFLEEWLRSGVLEAALFDMLDGVGKGFSVHEIMWCTEPGNVVPARLIYRPQRFFDVARDDLDTLQLRESVGREPLAPHKFVVHRHPAKSGTVMRSGLARVAAWAWMYKAFTLRDWAVFTQNFGQPIRVGRYGPEATEADRRVLWRAVANIAGDCAAIIPKGMDIEFIEAKGLSASTKHYEERADWLDRQVSKAVLGQTTTTDAVAGGHATSRTHRLIQEDIERADAKLLTATVTAQIGAPTIAFTFGPQAKYPLIRIGRPDEVPLAEWIAAIEKLIPHGLRVEASEVRDRLRLSEPADDAEVLGPAPAKPTAPFPLARLLSVHASQPEPEVVDALTERLHQDAASAMAGLTGQIREAMEAATDLNDLADRLSRLDLDQRELAAAMGRGMAIAHLAGEAAVLDGLAARRG